jgi:nicotinamide phosphoribosyltransferase
MNDINILNGLRKQNNTVADFSIIALSDSYKVGHHNMYPEGTQRVYSYFESRKGAQFDETVFFGLQYIIKRYLVGQVVTQEAIDAAAAMYLQHFGSDTLFNRAGWEYILKVHGGRLPVRIKAIPEGTPVTVSNILMSIENTDDNCWWLTNYLETILTHVWYGSTVATLSREVKKTLKHYYNLTATNDVGLNFGLQDFGFRGVSCVEQAGFGGAAHLINFLGSDTVVAMPWAAQYYNASFTGIGYSVPASEHSINTSLGRDGEYDLIQRLLDLYPKGILSVVSDSYDIYAMAETLGTRFKDQILARDGVYVCRPDSGDPEEVMLRLLNIFWRTFGGETNTKGYKVINSKTRLLWGDGLDLQAIKNILGAMLVNGWGVENIACFGMGGGLLHRGVNRDTQRSAFKCSAQMRNGKWVDIAKNPIDQSKKSKAGRLKLTKLYGLFETVREDKPGNDLLVTVFENGELLVDQSFSEIRERAKL